MVRGILVVILHLSVNLTVEACEEAGTTFSKSPLSQIEICTLQFWRFSHYAKGCPTIFMEMKSLMLSGTGMSHALMRKMRTSMIMNGSLTHLYV